MQQQRERIEIFECSSAYENITQFLLGGEIKSNIGDSTSSILHATPAIFWLQR